MSDKKERPLPRARGNAVRKGSDWTWELMLTYGESKLIDLGPKDDQPLFLTKKAAIADMRKTAEEILDKICKDVLKVTPTGIIDMNKGVKYDHRKTE